MKILHQNATEILLNRIYDLGKSAHRNWRCIHIHLSDKPERYNHGLRSYFVARTIIRLLRDMDGYLFLCDDGDIFLLYKGQLKPVVEKLETHFTDIGDLAGTSAERRFTVYDLNTDWASLYRLCHDRAVEERAAPEGFYSAFAYSLDEVRA